MNHTRTRILSAGAVLVAVSMALVGCPSGGGGETVQGFAFGRAGEQALAPQQVGYEVPPRLDMRVTNVSGRAVSGVSVGLSGANPDRFDVEPTAVGSLEAGESFTVTVIARAGLELGVHATTVTVSGAGVPSRSFDVSFEVASVIEHGIALDASGTVAMPFLFEGYISEDDGLAVVVTSIGEMETGVLDVQISGRNAAAFLADPPGLMSIPAGGRGGFRIVPRTDLEAGTYEATVTVWGTFVGTHGFDITLEVRPAEENANIDADFTDAAFRSQVRSIAGVAPHLPIMLSDIINIRTLRLLGGVDIQGFAGLQHFVNLEILDIGSFHGGMAAGTPQSGTGGIDLSVVPTLREFHANAPGLSQNAGIQWITLDNPVLHTLIVNPTRVASFDTAGAPALERFALMRAANLTSLDTAGSPILRELNLWGSDILRTVVTSGNPRLTHLLVNGGMSSRDVQLDLSQNAALEWLHITDAGLSSFDGSNLVNLEDLNLMNNQLSGRLDLSGLPSLYEAWAERNNLSSVDISGSATLWNLNVQANSITDMTFGGNTGLMYLNLNLNGAGRTDMNHGTLTTAEVEQWDFTEAPNLHFLNLSQNAITSLNLATMPNLRALDIILNEMLHPDDVEGWQTNGLRLGAPNVPTMQFEPQMNDINNPVQPTIVTEGFTVNENGDIVLPDGVVGQEYGDVDLPWTMGPTGTEFTRGIMLHATGTGRHGWSAVGNLPGFYINPSPGAILGVPSVAGTFSLNITVLNSAGQTEMRRFVVTIRPAS